MSDRGKTTANPDGFARILTMGRRKYARQNHGSDTYSHPSYILLRQDIIIHDYSTTREHGCQHAYISKRDSAEPLYQKKIFLTKISIPIRINMIPPTTSAWRKILPKRLPIHRPNRQMTKVTAAMIKDASSAMGSS